MGWMLKKEEPLVGSWAPANPLGLPLAKEGFTGVEGRSSPKAPLRFVRLVLLFVEWFNAEDRSFDVSLNSGCLRAFRRVSLIRLASCSEFNAELAISAVDRVCAIEVDSSSGWCPVEAFF